MKTRDGSWARVANLMLGGWLFVSAFLWDHSNGQRANAAIVGFLVFASALGAVTSAQLRLVNTALAMWLFVSTLALPGAGAGTQWNNALVALAVFLFSLVAPRRERRIILRVRKAA